METIVRKIFIGFRPLCTVFHPVMPAGQLFYRVYGRDKNIFLLTIPALVQDVINNGVLCGAVYGNFKVNPRLFLVDMDGLFSKSMSQNLNARMSQLRRLVCSANRRIA